MFLLLLLIFRLIGYNIFIDFYFLTDFGLLDQIIFDSLERIAVIAYIKTCFDTIVFISFSWSFIVDIFLCAKSCTNSIEVNSALIATDRSVSYIYLYSYFFIHLIKLCMRSTFIFPCLVLLVLLNHGSSIHLSISNRYRIVLFLLATNCI